jgi:hypothetical protein
VPPGVATNNRQYEGGLGPAFEAMLHRIDDREADQARRGIQAWLLAPTIPIYQALIRGETVPPEQLNQEALRSFGIRQRGAA